jgi:hypothetical protein
MSCCLPFFGLNLTKTLETVVDVLNDNSGVELKNVNVILEEAAAVCAGVVSEAVDVVVAGVVAEAVDAVAAGVVAEAVDAVAAGVVAEAVDAVGVVAEAVDAVGAGVVAEAVDTAETIKDNIKKEEERQKIKENVRTLVRQVVGSTKN